MQKLVSLLFFVASSVVVLAQEGLLVKYDIDSEFKTEENQGMEFLMEGSSMTIASSADRGYVKLVMGFEMTTEVKKAANEVTMVMTFFGNDMIYQGSLDSLRDDSTNVNDAPFEFKNETKKILGYKCKKAIQIVDGFENVYWYTEDIKNPEEVKELPSQLPGMALEMVVETVEGITTFTATVAEQKTDISSYTIVIPEGAEVLPIEDLYKTPE
ncbi:hypothetical protein K6119_09500 [Paracrocinitomix mangrovi]|uniref:hypothetical protein n=1 Tax=Paracrocinitomix mangrovi TaxID=2862509 RepID=UPI001C8D1210|nr:hypothetical protein [Paracrocinitomix mangrovi]UKN03725.1 hypothetical protein K6119_09500 [Paracrocinitomix mangrovi]